MPKKKSKGTSKKAGTKQEEPLPEENKPPSASKSANNEIDEIFSGKKRKMSEPKSGEKPNGDEISKPKSLKKVKKSKESKGERSLDEPSSGSRKRTGDGLAIYTEEELGFNKSDAGNTSLCPFDCDCCF